MVARRDRPKAVAWTVLEAGCAIAALLLYLLSLSGMSGPGHSDPATRGLQALFAVVVIFLLWLPLTAFVALRCRTAKQGGLLAMGIAMCLAGMIFSIWAASLLETSSRVRIAPTALPPLALLYGIWAPFGATWPARGRRLALVPFVGLAAASALLVLVEQYRWDAAAPEREAAMNKAEADYRQQESDLAARQEAEFRALGPDSRLEQFFPFIGGEHDAEAIMKIRALRSALADAVRLLDDDTTELYEFRRMPEFGLAVTPELCASYRRRIARKLARLHPRDPDTNAISELATYIDNFRWLHGNGCSMADQAAQVAAQLRRHPNDSVRADGAMFEAIR